MSEFAARPPGATLRRTASTRRTSPSDHRMSPKCSCSTSRSARWTSNFAKRCRSSSSEFNARSGITFIYVTHDQEEALTISDRLAVFRSGRIEQIGPPSEVYETPGDGVRGVLRRDVERDRSPWPRGGRSCVPRRSEMSRAALGEDRGRTSARGRVIDVMAYLGMVTRYKVELDERQH